jgi:nitrite reductase (NO-forming)
MQGDFYLTGDPTQSGVHEAVVDKMVKETPDYVVFNGSAGSLSKEHALKAKVGETVRIFFGNAGPNTVSSFHVIGEIFDKVYPEGASEPHSNVQSTLVPAGGATIVEFKLEVPGTYILVDHSLARLQKGAAGFLVEGAPNQGCFKVSIRAAKTTAVIDRADVALLAQAGNAGSDKTDEFDARAGKILASTSTMALRSDTFEGATGMP